MENVLGQLKPGQVRFHPADGSEPIISYPYGPPGHERKRWYNRSGASKSWHEALAGVTQINRHGFRTRHHYK